MDSFTPMLLTICLVVFVFVFPVYLLGVIVDLFEKKYKRSKFKVSYILSFSGVKGPLAFKDVESLAIKARVTNSQAVIALDELNSQRVEEKNKSISKDDLEKIQGQFRVASKFDKIPENLKGHIDKLKASLPEDNVDLFKLEEEIQEISKNKHRYKYYSIILSLVTITGTIYTILGYYKVGG